MEKGAGHGVMLYTFAFIGGCTTVLVLLGLIHTAFSSLPNDYVEEALEEVTRKRKRK